MPLLILGAAFIVVLLITWALGRIDRFVIHDGTRARNHPRFIFVGMALGFAGFVLAFGYLDVTVADITAVARGITEDQPAPIALAYVGGMLMVVGLGLVVYGLVAPPPANAATLDRHPSGCGAFLMALALLAVSDAAAVAVTLSARHSSLRWRPLEYAAIWSVIGLVGASRAALPKSTPIRDRRPSTTDHS